MKKEHYLAVFAWFNAHPAARQALKLGRAGSVAAVYLLYGGLLCFLAWRHSARLWPVLAIPAAVFLLGTLLRKAVDRPRPYEALGFTPLFPKNTVGQSMPSRHCFSAAAIAVAATSVFWPLGVAAWVLAGCIAVSRVLAGAHYPSDVLAGLGFGALGALLGFALWMRF